MKHRRLLFWFASAAILALGGILVTGTLRDPRFWMSADQRGDRLFDQQKYAEAASAYADPWRIGMAQYRNGDFEAAAHTFARVPGANGAFDQGNALLMHGQYDAAVSAYDRALGFAPHWALAEENKALALARKERLGDSGKDAEKESAEAYQPDKIVFDQKGKNGVEKPMELNEQTLSDEQLRTTWLRRVQTTPGDFLRAKFSYQAAMSGQESGK